MDDHTEQIEAVVLIFTGLVMGAMLTVFGLRAGGLLLEIIGMDLETAKVVAAFIGSSSLTLLLVHIVRGYIRYCMSTLRKMRERRKQRAEETTRKGGNEHERKGKD